MTRIKNPTFTTIETFQEQVDRIAALELKIRAAEADRDSAINRITFNHNKSIEGLVTERNSLMSKADVFARQHRTTLIPGKRKSASNRTAIFGFRQSTRTVQDMTVDEAVEFLKSLGFDDCYKEKRSLNMGVIKAKAKTEKALNRIFHTVTTDNFYVEPKVERLEQKEESA